MFTWPFPANLSIAACALLGGCVTAAAQSLEAARYVNAQGVEILTNRTPPRPRGDTTPAVPDDPRNAVLSASGAPGKQARPQPGAPGPVDAREAHRVSGQEQSARDEERQRILMGELMNEQQQLETKKKALRSPRAQTDLTEQEQRRIGEAIERHESNIRSLQQEIAPRRGGTRQQS